MDRKKYNKINKFDKIAKRIDIYLGLLYKIFAIFGITVIGLISFMLKFCDPDNKPKESATPIPKSSTIIEKNFTQQPTQELTEIPTPEPTPTEVPEPTPDISTYICITSKSVNLNISPDSSSKKVGVLHFGQIAISLFEGKGKGDKMWHKISDGYIQGYVPSECVKILNSDKEKYIQLLPDTVCLNVRRKPNIKSKILTQIPEEYAYKVLKAIKKKKKIKWYKIQVDEKTYGYVSAEYTTSIGNKK